MGRLLEIVRTVAVRQSDGEVEPADGEKSELSELRSNSSCLLAGRYSQRETLLRFGRLFRTLDELERRCPDYINTADWQQTVEDGRRFLTKWGEYAEAFGWTPADVFGLAQIPDTPAARFERLSRHDQTGLVWMLHGCSVIALTATAAAIGRRTGGALLFRRFEHRCSRPLTFANNA